MFDNSTYTAQRARLEPGDLLVLYSDGITEAESPDGTPFDEEGLVSLISAHAGNPSLVDIGKAIIRAVELHAQDVRFADDLTVLLATKDGGPGFETGTRDSGLGTRRTVCRRFRAPKTPALKAHQLPELRQSRAPSPEPRAPDSAGGAERLRAMKRMLGAAAVLVLVLGQARVASRPAAAPGGRRPPPAAAARAVDAGRRSRALHGPAVGAWPTGSSPATPRARSSGPASRARSSASATARRSTARCPETATG